MATKNNYKLGIFVDIDSIMDTRLTVLHSIDEDIASKQIKSGAYFTRLKDEFDYITYDMFKYIYKNRNKQHLRLATPTPMLDLIKEYVLVKEGIFKWKIEEKKV